MNFTYVSPAEKEGLWGQGWEMELGRVGGGRIA